MFVVSHITLSQILQPSSKVTPNEMPKYASSLNTCLAGVTLKVCLGESLHRTWDHSCGWEDEQSWELMYDRVPQNIWRPDAAVRTSKDAEVGTPNLLE